jgi:hypothetical protein
MASIKQELEKVKKQVIEQVKEEARETATGGSVESDPRYMPLFWKYLSQQFDTEEEYTEMLLKMQTAADLAIKELEAKG